MTDKCDKCSGHRLECRCINQNEDQLIRDMLINSSSRIDNSSFSDEPTILELYDTVEILSRRNPEWRKNNFCCMIFAWNANTFIKSHADDVCKEKCPELIELCDEYRRFKTMKGLSLSPMFGLAALQYIMLEPIYNYDRFGTAPVRDSYFLIEKNSN